MKKPIFVIALALTAFVTSQTIAQTTDSATTKTDTARSSTQTTTSSATGTGAGSSTNTSASGTGTTGMGDVVSAISKTGYNATFGTAIKTAGLESALQGAGPYTIFAPSDQALTTASAAASWLNDKAKLETVLKSHVVSGKYTKDDIIKALSAGKGKATLNTIDGGTVTLKVNANKNLELSDTKGNSALVTVFDQQATNGVVHVINGVLMAPAK
jgi:uncharacterized surface protein with fasciclin (FAS1) repeats